VSAVSPFRLFGRPPEPEPALESGEGASWAPGAWDGEPRPATRHARPVAFGGAPGGLGGLGGGVGGGVDHDPPTDPHGFPPILAEPRSVQIMSGRSAASGAAGDRSVGAQPSGMRRVAPARPRPAPDPLEAAALAGAFAADYLSWDEDDPGRRGRALADHLAAPVGDPALLGWDGRGRQRADFALPGLVRSDGDDRVLVDVRVRVTPYREVAGRDDRAAEEAEAAEPEPDVLGTPAAAPAPTGRGWRGCASYWVRLSVPVIREDGRLVVDAAEEAADLDGELDRAGHADRGSPGGGPGRDLDGGPGADRHADLEADLDDGPALYAELRELREGPPARAERAAQPTSPPSPRVPESAW